MLSVEQFSAMITRLTTTDSRLSAEIRRITSKIAAHREEGGEHMTTLLSSPHDRQKYHTWRRISCHLHQRRSRLKTEQEKTRCHLEMVRQRLEELNTDVIELQVFQEMGLEIEPAPANA